MEAIITFQVIFNSFLGDQQRTCGPGCVRLGDPILTFDMIEDFHKDIYQLLKEYLHSRVINGSVKLESNPQNLEDAVTQRQVDLLFNNKIQRCPVCEGRGTMPGGFYARSSCVSIDAKLEICKSCNGKGYIRVYWEG